MTMSRSAMRIAAATFASMSKPAWPTYDGCRLSRWSWRRNAATTGRSNAAANLPTCMDAASLQPPPPSMRSGRSAALSFALSRVIWLADGARAGGCAVAPSLASALANKTSSGKPRTTGPGRPERAALKARATNSGMRSASRTMPTQLATSPNMASRSISWKAPRPSSARSINPTRSTIGVASWCAT